MTFATRCRHACRVLAGLVALALATGPAGAQELTLGEALQRADAAAYANRIADGQARVAAGQADLALRGILPAVRLEGSYTGTTDPLNAFGFTLRQRQVTEAAFDPARLNDPASIDNVGAGAVAEVPLFNGDAWLGRRAGRLAADAAHAQRDWTRMGTRTDVVRAYFGSLLALEQVATLDTALRSADAHVAQAQSLVRNGLATRSDALLAEVRRGEVAVRLAEARSAARIARWRLALVLGSPGDTALALPVALPPADRVRALAAAGDGAAGLRADVLAARLGSRAAAADERRTLALWLPRVNGFGRLDWNSPSALFGGKRAWTAGVMVQWSPFAGASELAERRAAAGRRAVAETRREAAEAQAALEAASASSRVQVALERLDIAERSVAQAAEAHRIVGRKYEGGLAGVTELLDALAAETAARLGFSAARYELIEALAVDRQARGADVAALAALDE